MFTGIVKELGSVEAVESSEEGSRLRIAAGLSSELEEGDSVAVNGACLTATSIADGSFEADVMHQTLSVTTLGELERSSPVNLELPLRASDRLGGHVVQGHVDGTATVTDVSPDGFARRLSLDLPEDLLPLVVEGVSLTISGLTDHGLEVSLIPETLERTTLGSVEPGDHLNIECDVLARYVQRQLSPLSKEH
jgi:riboflavin synthase